MTGILASEQFIPDNSPFMVTPLANTDVFWRNRLRGLAAGWTVAQPTWLQAWAYERYSYEIPEAVPAGSGYRATAGQLTP
jgi:hypothetical protein